MTIQIQRRPVLDEIHYKAQKNPDYFCQGLFIIKKAAPLYSRSLQNGMWHKNFSPYLFFIHPIILFRYK